MAGWGGTCRPGKGDVPLSSSDARKSFTPDEAFNPIESFSARKMTRKERIVKEAIASYHVSEVDDTSVIYVGETARPILTSLELPDAECDGLTFKQRLVQTDDGDFLLLARWKPDRYMRRTAPDWSQRWFVEKQLFPPNGNRFLTRLEKSVETSAEEEN